MIPELSTRWERDLGHDSAWKISLSYQWLSPATHLNETAMYQGIAVYCFSATYTPVCVLLLWETVTNSSRHWVASNPDLSLKQSFIDCGIGSRGRNQRDFFFLSISFKFCIFGSGVIVYGSNLLRGKFLVIIGLRSEAATFHANPEPEILDVQLIQSIVYGSSSLNRNL